MWYVAATVLVLIAAAVVYRASRVAREKNLGIIVAGHMRRRREAYTGTRHVFFCFVDHYEPLWHGADERAGIERVEMWHRQYPLIVDRHRDNGGFVPQHVFFYPQEEYLPQCLEMLADLQRRGFGEVEIHLHHDNDTAEGFREKIESFKATLHEEHGLLRNDPASGRLVYGFIHGNWALDDSGAGGRHCGVRDEISVLRDTGCYADFTYPSAPHPTQPPVINRIYYATGSPDRRASHHRGVDARYGSPPSGDLLLINGPLALNWRRRKAGLMPAVENGDITDINPGTLDRADLWVRTGVHVAGWPRWVFIKLHTHGAQEANAGYLLSPRGGEMYADLLRRFNDGKRYVLHFVTAWQMFRCVKALERGDEAAIEKIERFEYD
jgi:hypothetical protein